MVLYISSKGQSFISGKKTGVGKQHQQLLLYFLSTLEKCCKQEGNQPAILGRFKMGLRERSPLPGDEGVSQPV